MGNRLLPVILALALLSGCSTTPSGVEFQTAHIPKPLLRCLPPVHRNKKLVRISTREGAALLAYYKTAHGDCYRKVMAIARIHSKGGL